MFIKNLAPLFVLIILSVSASAQKPSFNYDRSWKRIDSLINKNGQPKTALKEVNALFDVAKKDKNEDQLIKALVYKLNINQQLSENSDSENIKSIENEITIAKEPAKSILNSIAASYYWNYLQKNRYKFYNRTDIPDIKNNDIATSGAEGLHKKIAGYYIASISQEQLLRQTNLSAFEPIIIKGNTRELRPTLYDLLAHRALEYFKTGESDITRPAKSFEIEDTVAFAEAKVFSSHKFATNDSASLHFRALEIFVKLIAFHLNDQNKNALTDVDIERIQFANQYSTIADKTERYSLALQQLANSRNSSMALYLLAEMHAGKAADYDPLKDTSSRYEYNKAEILCKLATADKDSSEGKISAQRLLTQIQRREIRMKSELVDVPGIPFRALIDYRNVTSFSYRIIKLERETKERFGTNNWEEKFWKEVLRIPAIVSKELSFPATSDHQFHRLEIPIDALPAGEYALIGSSDKDFTLNNNTLAIQNFYVSNIAFINSSNDYYLLNRTTGAPLSKATIQLWKNSYINGSSKLQKLPGSYTADKNGFIQISHKQGNSDGAYIPEFNNGKDKLFIATNFTYSYDYNEIDRDVTEKDQVYFFTDRGLYRPGQTVYFKGILVGKNRKGSIVLANQKSKIYLNDENGDAIDSLDLVTNAYGSYSGKFTIPVGLLNGNFTIEDDETESQVAFNVEEYKRPKFEVSVIKPSGSYRVNDTIHVTGSAKAYSGYAIDGAKLTYSIQRKYIRIYDYYFSSKIWPPSGNDQMEIAHGILTTAIDGSFTIPFKAIPDAKIPASQNPTFNYTVTVDVTDVNGETRSTETNISVGYHAIKLDMSVPDFAKTDSFKLINISSVNSNDLFEPAKTSIRISKLITPTKTFRERFWEQPDQFIMTREEYYNKFPFDFYSNEGDITSWTTEKEILSTAYTTVKDSAFRIPKMVTEPGWYAIQATTKDKYNDSVTIIKYIQLYNDKIISPIATVKIEGSTKAAIPGDQINYALLTNLDSAYLIREILRQHNSKEIALSGPVEHTTASKLNVVESDKGGIKVNTMLVKNNRFYSADYFADVPFFDKQLKIEYLSFRDKTLPGSNEKWKVKITGARSEKVNAELLTSMYDASLDQFEPHNWNVPALWSSSIASSNWRGETNFKADEAFVRDFNSNAGGDFTKDYDRLIIDEPRSPYGLGMQRGKVAGISASAPSAMMGNLNEVVVTAYGISKKEVKSNDTNDNRASASAQVQPRTNLNETAFFFPTLNTDTAGNIEFTFTTPEALTQWKWMLLAHTKNLAFGYSERTMITQKQLMVQPNPPRFLRQGDTMQLSAKVVNMSNKNVRGKALLQLFDATTHQNIDNIFGNTATSQNFSIRTGQSAPIFYPIVVPKNFTNPITWRITASADLQDSLKAISNISDGEEATLPVISNRILVTETLPLPTKTNTTKNFSFEKLLKSGNSKTLQQSGITVEFTSNPAWYAVQALPYLVEGEKENAEAAFNRFYANALAATIANVSPRFKSIMQKWRTTDTAALLSNLQKNEDLKSVLLQETPWVLEAKTESQQKKNVALLFEAFTISKGLESALSKLTEMQSPSGAFTWYKDGPADRYMTTYIVSGIGRLKKLNAIPQGAVERLNNISKSAIAYLDNEIKQDYKEIKNKKRDPADDIDNEEIQYLYMRSLFPDDAVPGDVFAAYNYYRNLSKTTWIKKSNYMRGLIALSLFRTGDVMTSKKIMTSLKENAINNDELGMYWKDNNGGYYWYQAPIESQVTMIEAFSEITKDNNSVNNMKTWLLKNKQTNNWNTTRSTADACYALLLQGPDWTSEQPSVVINLGDTTIKSTSQNSEAGTGYFKTIIPEKSVKPSMGNVSVAIHSSKNKDTQPAWGAIYWQYFEDLDKITSASTPLQLNKKLFIVKNSDRGQILQPLDASNTLKIGDKIKVRIELRADRDMEYVHMKDMRAACMEPVNVISTYKYQDGLGYYESTKDASTNFYFGSLPKGVYVFEYELTVTHSGEFSNGITTIQCMYAPEFTSHSEGINVKVEKQ